MAKTRSGLGRGLGSLLGGGPDGTLPQESPSKVERVVVNAPKEEEKSKPETIKEEKKPEPETKKEELKKEVQANKQGDVYTNKEDNITIKGVVEREVPVKRPTVAPKPKKEEVKENNGLEIDISLIDPNPNQPRTNFKSEELEELAQSIKKNGLLQPILVRKMNDRYQIVAGERRWQACKIAEIKTVPVAVIEADDDEAYIYALVENIQRTDLNPIEEAYGYKRMMERGKMTQSEVAQAVSKGRTTITNALRLLELPEEAQQLLYEEKITAGHARAILSVPTKEGKKKLTDKLVEEKLSVRDAERIARLLAGKNNEKKTPRVQAPKSYKTVARALKDTLETEVKIKSVKGKNKIEIEFKDEADLERLFRKISKQ